MKVRCFIILIWFLVDITSVGNCQTSYTLKQKKATNTLQKSEISPIIAEPFTVEEYPLVLESRPMRGDEKQLGKKILSKRVAWRGVFNRESRHKERRTLLNEKLVPFGHKLLLTNVEGWKLHYRSDLYRDGKLLLENIMPRSVEVNESRTAFALIADNTPNTKPSELLIRKNSIQPYYSRRNASYPVFLGDKLITIDWEEKKFTRPSLPWTYMIKCDDAVIYTGSVGSFPFVEPIRALYSRNGHWILEVCREVIIDGKSLNKKLGYDKIFRYVFYKDKPLYFFKKNGKVGISYDRKVLPVTYEEVPHYACCDNVGIAINDDMLWFFGLRNGTWYYVEMGIYE